ncbi:arginyltransferase [Acetobacter conturbans]|uniref:Aspartate/glutamate leucyltransferase n=1 Tax=Acetobacter conturbans TaxID=1737472 RepID=A0ABX0K2J9_9PROT|nr:arginyltransferase [Acetobacter conturbans]NHN88918.1 arginyltransferase [Acetobacter conturbans]
MTFSSRHPQFFYTTAPQPCPYLPDRLERKVVTDLSGPNAETLHDRLSRAGFRRSHAIAYAPVCNGCNACVPIRIPVTRFIPTRTQKRILKANVTLEGFEVPARATAEQFVLFRQYQTARHADGDMAGMNFSDYRSMVEDTPIDTFIVEFRTPENELMIVSLVDALNDGLSAVYSFYDPTVVNRSLGSFSIMWLIEQARRRRLEYVYLGYWIAQSRKMAYKTNFRPAEILSRGAWRDLETQDLPQETDPQ